MVKRSKKRSKAKNPSNPSSSASETGQQCSLQMCVVLYKQTDDPEIKVKYASKESLRAEQVPRDGFSRPSTKTAKLDRPLFTEKGDKIDSLVVVDQSRCRSLSSHETESYDQQGRKKISTIETDKKKGVRSENEGAKKAGNEGDNAMFLFANEFMYQSVKGDNVTDISWGSTSTPTSSGQEVDTKGSLQVKTLGDIFENEALNRAMNDDDKLFFQDLKLLDRIRQDMLHETASRTTAEAAKEVRSRVEKEIQHREVRQLYSEFERNHYSPESVRQKLRERCLHMMNFYSYASHVEVMKTEIEKEMEKNRQFTKEAIEDAMSKAEKKREEERKEERKEREEERKEREEERKKWEEFMKLVMEQMRKGSRKERKEDLDETNKERNTETNEETDRVGEEQNRTQE
uniref:Uncharacterized protein n=1 Tax=Palpitomonas bilix TaxID=652834 RepID=A0A7S3DDY6_9EUKA|mmetsp:Transcript_33627/g.86140  ORF Transcript_33627/g.86140 Transcript_33627/m.86140 type:complete len:402 (+) Transcript_33627:494-1699(+)